MENQYRKITGYRELNQEEIDLTNKIKALGPQIEAVIIEVQNHVARTRQDGIGDPDIIQRITDATPERFAALAKTDFQIALMYLTRAVAQPTFF